MSDDPHLDNMEELHGGPHMDISEHLEELRSRIIRALIGIAVVLAGCLFYQDEIMRIITRPHMLAMKNLQDEIEKSSAKTDKKEPTKTEKIQAAINKLKKEDPENAALLEMIASEIFEFEDQSKKRQGTLQSIKYQEAFVSYLKACIVAALILASPWIFLQMWGFVGAGLYPREKKYILVYLPFSFLAFAAGVVFGYFLLIPEGLTYLAKYASPELVTVKITLGGYLSFFLMLTVALGLVFQLPLVMMFLARAGIFTPKQYARYRKYAILTAPIVGAILTPPDPVTQILLASPMLLLYELGIWLSRLTVKKKTKEATK